MKLGRHARPKQKSTKQIAVGASAIVGGSVVVPVTLAGSAEAATVAEWDRVARCESGGQWNLPSGDRDSTGGLQFRVASWHDALAYLRRQGISTSGYPSMPYQATKQQQIMAGEALLAMQGPRAWSVTFNGGAHCGNAARGALSTGSMFEGGPKPFVAQGPTTTPKPPPAAKYHTVIRGDYLAKIAAKYSILGGWKTLYAANRTLIGANPNRIFPGQRLALPGAQGSTPTPKPPPKPPLTPPTTKAALPVVGRVGDTVIYRGSCVSRSCGGHSGLDISAPSGTPVKSAMAGTVVSINASGGAYGIHVVVKHADGLYTLYAHLSAHRVRVGQTLVAGQQLGNVGSTGNSNGAHLHFEVRNHPTAFSASVFRNPLTWLRSQGLSI